MSLQEFVTKQELIATRDGPSLARHIMPTDQEVRTYFSNRSKSQKSASLDYIDCGTISELYGEKTPERQLNSSDKNHKLATQYEVPPRFPNSKECSYIFKALDFIYKIAKEPSENGLEQGGSINSKTGESHMAIPGPDNAKIPFFSGTTDIVMTHLKAIINNPGFRNSFRPEQNDYDNATQNNVRMWAINHEGNIFMFAPANQHVYEWKSSNKTSTPDYDLGVRAAAAMFPTKFTPKTPAPEKHRLI
jgi:hypothetical protein